MKKFKSAEERREWERERKRKQRAVPPKDVPPLNVPPLEQHETVLDGVTINPPLETVIDKAVKKIPEVKHIKLTPELLKELSVQSWSEEGPVMLNEIPTSKNIEDIVALIKAKHGGTIHYGPDTSMSKGKQFDEWLYGKWREKMYPKKEVRVDAVKEG